jgi:hypothetical protein
MKRDAIREERVLSLFTITTPLEEVRLPVTPLTCGKTAGKTLVLSSAWTDFGALATEIWKGKVHVLSHLCLSTHYNQRILEVIFVNFSMESFAKVCQNMLIFVHVTQQSMTAQEVRHASLRTCPALLHVVQYLQKDDSNWGKHFTPWTTVFP